MIRRKSSQINAVPRHRRAPLYNIGIIDHCSPRAIGFLPDGIGVCVHPRYGIEKLLQDIPPFTQSPDVANAVIEIPKGRRSKFELDKRYNVIRLDRYLYSASHYPGDYGFIPQTLADDGDALDILVMVSEPTFPGCLIEARVLGMFTMIDTGRRDDKILSVPNHDPLYDSYRRLDDVPPHFLKEVEHFFSTYKQLEGATVKPGQWYDRIQARETLQKSADQYQKER